MNLVISTGIRDRIRLMYNRADTIVVAAEVERFAAYTRTEIVEMTGPSHAPWGLFDIGEQLRYLESHV
jgi:hypothetical protein